MNTKLKRILKGSALALAGLLIAALLAGTWISCAASSDIDREMARIAAAREPVKLSEIAPPPVAEDQNAAPALMKALKPLDKDEEIAALFDTQGRLKPDAAEKAKAVVSARAELIKQIREALTLPACRYTVSYEDGFEAALPHILLIVKAGRLLAAESDLQRRAGAAAASADSAFDIIRLADTLRSEATLVALMVRVALTGLALDRFEGMTLTPEQETRLAVACDAAALRQAIRTAWLGERAFGIHAYVGLLAGDRAVKEGMGLPWIYTSWFSGPYLRRDFVHYLELMRSIVDLPSKPYAEASGVLKLLEFNARGSTLGLASLTNVIMTAYSGSYRRCAELGTRLDEARLSIAVRRDGALPAKVPADPFNGKPYSFKKTADGFVIWSVGADGVDDGGDPKKDVVWTHRN